MASPRNTHEIRSSQDYDIPKKDNPSINAVSDGSQHTSASDSKEHYTSTQSFFRSLRRYIWDDPDKPKHEKRFLLKLDFYLLTYACVRKLEVQIQRASLACLVDVNETAFRMPNH